MANPHSTHSPHSSFCFFLSCNGGRVLRGGLLPGGNGRRRQLPPGVRHKLGRRPGKDPQQRPAPHALPRPHLRLRLPVQERVPLRQDRYADQARPRQLCWHRHRLLPVVARADARRDRLRVPRQRHRRALHAPHQRLYAGEGRPGDAVQALVRSHRRFPYLLHPVEPAAHHIHGGRDADPGLQEPGSAGDRVPEEPADADLLESVERRRLGDTGRAGEDGLEQGALRRLLPGLQCRRLPPRQRHRRGRRSSKVLRLHQERVVEPGARPGEPGEDEVGPKQVHDLPLLPRRKALPAGPPAGVRRRVIDLCTKKREKEKI